MIEINKNLYALLENHEAPDRKQTMVLEGSARSGKTWSVLEYFINSCYQMPGIICTVFRNDATTHEKAGVRDFKQLISNKYTALWMGGKWNSTQITFTFANGSIIEFAGANDAQKLQGPERDFAFINEAIECTFEAYRQIVARTRHLVILDFNPSLNAHWVFDSVLGRDDVLYVHTTYRDNPHLSEKIVQEIERSDPSNPENIRQGTADKWFWEVYGLGQRGRREGAIFTFYDVVEYWPEPHDCQKWGFGLDFGYSADPCALVECAIFQGKLHLREWLYETGYFTIRSHAQPNAPSIQGHFEKNNFDRNWKTVADPARPDQIAELVAEGFNVTGGPKGPGSIVAGIDLMKRFPICVHRSSTNMQMELQQYAWKQHANGTWLDVPEDNWNHLIDATRYWCLEELSGWQPGSRGRSLTMAVAGKARKRY